MMNQVLIFAYKNDIIEFQPFSYQDGLPFPLYLPSEIKYGICLMLLLTLHFGIKYRAIIFSYLLAPSTKTSPINYLIWIDQINGIFLGLNILAKILSIAAPVPLEEVFGSNFCEWIDLPGCFYISGSYIWSSFTAIYRILFLKAGHFVKNVVGEWNLLKILLILGFILQLIPTVLLTMFDFRSSSEKLCGHYSTEEKIILQMYKV
jgi:hypothetical protein